MARRRFAVLALITALRRRAWRGSPLIWLWIALCFGAVSFWLQRGA